MMKPSISAGAGSGLPRSTRSLRRHPLWHAHLPTLSLLPGTDVLQYYSGLHPATAYMTSKTL